MKDFRIKAGTPASMLSQWDKKDQELKKACEEFESLLKYELLKSMRQTVVKCDLFHGGQGEEIYQSLLDQELAKAGAGYGGNSLAGLLYQQFKDRYARAATGGDLTESGGASDGRLPLYPVRGTISSDFGNRKDPIDGKTRFHYGIDLAANEGSHVRACLPGRVLTSEYHKGYGNMVVLEHAQGFTTLYAHNQKNLVRKGDWVKQGTPIARLGSSGRSTGPHLHFEVKRHGRHLNPANFLADSQE
jgi:murein DD-endopeptidase MepM/ murein hydrolase activator NlpD